MLCKYIEHNLELLLITNGNAPDLASILYHMLRLQIQDTFKKFRMFFFKVWWDFMTVYESLKGRFQILDLFIRFYKYVKPRLKLRQFRRKRFLLFRYEIHSIFYSNIWSTTWNYGWLKMGTFLIWQLVCIILIIINLSKVSFRY